MTLITSVLIFDVFFLSFKPLLVRKNELDKLRKDIKEQWQKEQKKMVC